MGFEYPRPSTAVQENLFLDTGQCQAAFPNFDKEVKEAMDSGPFALKRIKDNSLGPAVQGRIKDGKVCSGCDDEKAKADDGIALYCFCREGFGSGCSTSKIYPSFDSVYTYF